MFGLKIFLKIYWKNKKKLLYYFIVKVINNLKKLKF